MKCNHCDQKAVARGLCDKHYTRWKKGIPMDAPDRYGRFTPVVRAMMRQLYIAGYSCRQIAKAMEMSETQAFRLISAMGIMRTQEEAQPWKENVTKTAGHYRARKIFRKAYGRILPGFHVHHVDGNPLNNSLDNLVLMTHGDHMRHHRRLEKEARQRAQA